VSNAPSKPVSFSRPKVGYFSNRPRIFAGDTNDSEKFVALIFFALTYLVPSFTRYFLHIDGRIKIKFLIYFIIFIFIS
jgi:hypothetical protein